ncbi:WG repeat-containing protein [Sinomicrobium sp.]
MITTYYNRLFTLFCCALFLTTAAYSQKPEGQALRFGSDGLAPVTVGDKSYYINQNGQREFDEYEDSEVRWKWLNWGSSNDTAAFIVIKDGLKGLRRQDGTWILEPVYQKIETFDDNCWKVTKAGKQTFTSPSGELLPYFDEVGYLNGRYFDVKNDGKWGVYDRESKQLSIPATYDGFDYCGGCGRKSDYIYAQQNGKWGVISFDNQVLVPFTYDHSHWGGMRSDVWVTAFTKNDKSVVVHIPTGKEFMAQGNERLQIIGYSELVVSTDGKYSLIDTLAKEILPPVYDAITLPNANSFQGYYGPYAIVEKDGKKGIYASGRGLVNQPEWDDARIYDDYFALSRNGQYGLYDRDGRKLLAPNYTGITHINDYFYSSGSKGLTIFKTQQKALYGLYFVETGVEIPTEFHELNLHSLGDNRKNDLIVGEYQGEKAVFDFDGNELLPLAYTHWNTLDTTSLRYLRVGRNDIWGVYDTQLKKEVIPVRFSDIRPLSEGSKLFLAVTDNTSGDYQYGVYTSEGTELLPATYSSYGKMTDGYVLFNKDANGKNAQVVNAHNGRIIELPTPYAAAFQNSPLVIISTDERTGQLYHPVEQRSVSDLKFTYPYGNTNADGLAWLSKFSPNGRAWVIADGKYGLIDATGQWLKKPLYAEALSFEERNITVGIKAFLASDWRSQTGYMAYEFIGEDGKPITDQVYPSPHSYLMDMNYFMGDHLIIRKVDMETGQLMVGLSDTTGNVVLPSEYDAVEPFNNGQYLLLRKRGKFGIANSEGQLLLPVEFDNLLLDRYGSENGITFPILGYKNDEWRYYKEDGTVLSVEGVGDAPWTVNTGLW